MAKIEENAKELKVGAMETKVLSGNIYYLGFLAESESLIWRTTFCQ